MYLQEAKTSKKVADHCAALIKRHCGLIEFRNNGKSLICTNLQQALAVNGVSFFFVDICSGGYVLLTVLNFRLLQCKKPLCVVCMVEKLPLSRIENHWSSFCIKSALLHDMWCDARFRQQRITHLREIHVATLVCFISKIMTLTQTLCAHTSRICRTQRVNIWIRIGFIYFFPHPRGPVGSIYVWANVRNPPRWGAIIYKAQQSRAANRYN